MRFMPRAFTAAALAAACLFLAGATLAEPNGGKGKGGPPPAKGEPPFGKGDKGEPPFGKGDKGDIGKAKSAGKGKGQGGGKGR